MDRGLRWTVASLAATAFFTFLALAFPDMSRVLTIPMAALSFGVMVYFLWPELRDLHSRRDHRMVALIGMIVCGVGLLAFGLWYLWPASTQKLSPGIMTASTTQASSTGYRKEALWPIKSIMVPPNLLLSLYMTEESHITGGIDDFNWRPATIYDNTGSQYKIYCRIYYNVTSRTKYMSVYVPRGENIFKTLTTFSGRVNEFLSHSLENPFIKGWKMGFDTPEEIDLYPFSGRLYMYYDGTLDVEERGTLARVYREKGISVEFHGTVFALAAWENIRKGLVVAPAMFKVVHDKITKIPENAGAHKSCN